MKVKAIKLSTITFLLMLAVTMAAAAQDKDKPEQAAAKAENAQVKPGKETMGPSADSIRPYRPSGRDPFKKTVKPKGAKAKSLQSRMLGFPTLDVRRAEFRQKVDQARMRDAAEPDPVSQYLVSELDITGVFLDD